MVHVLKRKFERGKPPNAKGAKKVETLNLKSNSKISHMQRKDDLGFRNRNPPTGSLT